jgi:hypothetical protein
MGQTPGFNRHTEQQQAANSQNYQLLLPGQVKHSQRPTQSFFGAVL